MALVFLLKALSLIKKIQIKYYLVDHKLRKNSTQEAKLVASILKKFNCNIKILNWNGKKPSTNIQSLARNKRYSLLINQCKKDKIDCLLLGHHSDDLHENFLLRLLRGSGLKGLISFGKTSEYKLNGIKILRPLINSRKDELIYITKKVFNFFISDPSNLNENYKRIKIRNLMKKLEEDGLDSKKFKLTINNLQDSNRTIEFYVRTNIEKNSSYSKIKNTYILNEIFFEQPHEIIFRSLSLIMRKISKNYYSPRGKSIKNLILRIIENQVDKVTLGGCYIEKINKTIFISKENSLKS
jgi:tRNA(Ile)-lysidine synthase